MLKTFVPYLPIKTTHVYIENRHNRLTSTHKVRAYHHNAPPKWGASFAVGLCAVHRTAQNT